MIILFKYLKRINKQVMEQYTNFIQTSPKEAIDKWLDEVDIAYATGVSGISDTVYDELIRQYEKRFGVRTVVGYKPTRNEVLLPIAMMSLNKIMKDKELSNFTSKNVGPYVVMDKINGAAALYEISNGNIRLYNRGDGTIGTDLTHMVPYLKLPVLPFNVHVKGELVIYKNDYEPFQEEYKTNLSMINGLINSQSADPAKLALFHFIAYDMSFPTNQEIELKTSQTLEHLAKYGFTIPYAVVVNQLSIEGLSNLFKIRRRDAPYECDGLVITSDRPINYQERLIKENPKYSVAFKEYTDTAEAIVDYVEWEAGKTGMIKPTVKIHPVTINRVTIKSLTAFNAKWIVDNNVGKGARLLITHNTIPYILEVLQGTTPQLPPVEIYPEGSWRWNETEVDIVLLEANDEVKIAQIYEFFKELGAKYVGETTLAKFYFAGFNSIKKILETSREEFLAARIEGVGEGIIDRMIKSIQEVLPHASLAQLMAGSGAFGHGFGKRRSQAILDVYPNIFDVTPTLDQVIGINGFAQKTAERFLEGLPKFRLFINNIPILLQIVRGTLRPVTPLVLPVRIASPARVISPANVQRPERSIAGKSVVFTGFRDQALEKAIVSQGGDIKTGVSKKTNYVVVGGVKGQGSAKETKAQELGIPVLNIAEFRAMFGF